VRYSSKEEASQAVGKLNMQPWGNSTLYAQFITDQEAK
jgi:hypothetical protein